MRLNFPRYADQGYFGYTFEKSDYTPQDYPCPPSVRMHATCCCLPWCLTSFIYFSWPLNHCACAGDAGVKFERPRRRVVLHNYQRAKGNDFPKRYQGRFALIVSCVVGLLPCDGINRGENVSLAGIMWQSCIWHIWIHVAEISVGSLAMRTTATVSG